MPTELKLLHGERRPERLNLERPQPKPLLPRMPGDMSKAAQRVWRRILRDYRHTGVLTAIDTDVLRAYCEAVARYEQSASMLEQSGPLVRGARHGDLIKNPLHQIVRDNADLLRAFARELGLTPSARSALRDITPLDSETGDALDAWEKAR